MTDVLVKPAFVSALPDTGDTTRLGPNAWNAARLFSAGALGDLLYRDTGSATGASWLTAATGVLVWTGAGVAPTVTASPTLTGTNFTGIPFAALSDQANIARLDQAEVVAGAWTFGDVVKFPAGTDALPSIAFAGVPGTGLSLRGADGIGFASQGTVRMHLTGNALLPAYSSAITIGNLASPFLSVNAEYFAGNEIADPAAPAANSGRLYFKDNGAGKTILVVRFATGAVQTIATEP